MFGKIEIKGKIKLKTGMHIGGEEEFSAIGAVDSPVMRDKITDLPYIPGSSLKGKLRYLLFKKYQVKELDSKITHNNDDPRILRLFGSSNDKNIKIAHKSRLYFSDSFISNQAELEDLGLESFTEVKFENTIDRFTAVANPRQIERVIRGTEFDLSIIYNVEDKDEIVEDFKLLKEGLDILKYDYLGGHGSRGYGRVEFKDLSCENIIGDVEEDILKQIKEILG